MPIIKSAKKAARQNLKHRTANRYKRKLLVEEVSKIKKGVSKNCDKFFSLVDRATKTGVIHRRKAARLKSRLSKRLNKTRSS
jgi:small subunit ribosomal protein S20